MSITNIESQGINRKCVYGSNDTNEVAAMMSNRALNSGHSGGFNNNRAFTKTGYTRGYKHKNSFNKSTIQSKYCKCNVTPSRTVLNFMVIPLISKIKREEKALVLMPTM